jgi:hypothetical protein
MINVKYYLNGQVLYGFSEEIATINNLYDFIGTKENTIVPLMNKQFISKKAVYDLFTNTLEIFLINKVTFANDIFVKNYNDDLVDYLEYIGYVKSDICGTGKNLITNAAQGKYYFTDNDYSNGEMGYVCENNNIACGIASIRNDSDIYQWFRLHDGQVEYCCCMSYIDEWGDYEENEKYPIKLTPEEIINQFNTSK